MERRKKKEREGVRVPSMGINGLPFKLGPGRGRERRADDENESVTSCARVETGGRLSLSLSLVERRNRGQTSRRLN